MANMMKLQENLEKRGYAVSYFETAADATAYLCETLAGKTVGFGGSMSMLEMGLNEALLQCGTDLVGHWAGNTLQEAALAPVYISSVNGVSESGELINIDGSGNRVASTIFGHDVLYLIIGSNKVEETFEQALWRARNIAAPKNAQRLKKNTPCAVKGDKCYDCSSPDRICRALTVLWGPSKGIGRTEIILVNEPLGL